MRASLVTTTTTNGAGAENLLCFAEYSAAAASHLDIRYDNLFINIVISPDDDCPEAVVEES
jgi:hypothetical protein